MKICSISQFGLLFHLIQQQGYKILGPKMQDEAIVYRELKSLEDLPIGWMDEQGPGFYRLKRRQDLAYFGYNLGPDSWKRYLFPPKEKLWSAKTQGHKLAIYEEKIPEEKMAFIGVRACEIQAMVVLDAVFQHPLATYTQYQQRREQLLVIAVNCTTAAATCFCSSMDAGPEVKGGYDLALTEIIEGEEHYFLVQEGSLKGKELIEALHLEEASQEACQKGKERVLETEKKLQRKVENQSVHEVLLESWESKRWDEVAKRCVNCANCTMVCPTCFCSHTEELVSLDGQHADRWQTWDSCFHLGHSYMHGGSVRASAQSRYRQWLTHKFGTWWDQFGMSGCVGCGRCIAWCPVGIDVTEELTNLKKDFDEKHR